MMTFAAAIRASHDPRNRVHLASRRARSTRCGIAIARDRAPDGRRLTVGGATVMDRAGIVSCGKCLGAKPEGRIR